MTKAQKAVVKIVVEAERAAWAEGYEAGKQDTLAQIEGSRLGVDLMLKELEVSSVPNFQVGRSQ